MAGVFFCAQMPCVKPDSHHEPTFRNQSPSCCGQRRGGDGAGGGLNLRRSPLVP